MENKAERKIKTADEGVRPTRAFSTSKAKSKATDGSIRPTTSLSQGLKPAFLFASGGTT